MLDRQEMLFAEDEVVVGLANSYLSDNIIENSTNLYPEYKFSPPYGIWTGNIPLYAALPFYSQLIVHLDLFKNKKSFLKVYGITIEEMTELYTRNRLVIVLRTGYGNYPGFYDVLLKNNIPLNNRLEKIYLISRDESFQEYKDLIERKFPVVATSISSELEKKLSKKVGKKNARETIVNMMAQRFVKLSMIGLRDRALDIIDNYAFHEAYKELHAYNRSLAVPLMDAMGGWDNLDVKHIELIKQISVDTHAKRIALPRDLLFWLNQQLGYRYATEVVSGLSYLDMIEQADEAEENHNILIAMQKAFEESDSETYSQINKTSIELIKGLESHISRIEKTKDSFRKWISRPLQYACFMTSPFALALMEKNLSSGKTPDAIFYGLLGAGTVLLADRIKELERLAMNLRFGTKAVPTILWNRMQELRQSK